MAIIVLETGRTFSPNIQNSLGYIGLIEFGAFVAQRYGTTTEEEGKLKKME